MYSALSITRILEISNFSISRTNPSVPWPFRTRLGKKTLGFSNTRFLEHLGISNKYFSPSEHLSRYLELLSKHSTRIRKSNSQKFVLF